jgi:hypothetical protein
MLRATIWRDLRWRLLAALLLVGPPAAMVAIAGTQGPRTDTGVIVPLSDFLRFLDASWFHLPGGSAVLLPAAVLLAAAGTLVRPRDDVGYLFTLPLSRRRWLLAHAAAAVLALATLVLLVGVAFAVSAARAGASLSLVALGARSLGVLLAASAWVGPTLFVATLVRRALPTIVTALAALAFGPGDRFRLDIPARESTAMLAAWDPWAFADPRAWHSGVPVLSLLTAAALGVGGLLLAAWRMERMEP